MERSIIIVRRAKWRMRFIKTKLKILIALISIFMILSIDCNIKNEKN